ncbi:MAG: septum formation initiator family protein [Magnetococcales bacterium]|nr:septum formation initiator family protein [Magnetococcales bacterium]
MEEEEEQENVVSPWSMWIGLFLVVANVWAQYLLWFGEQGLVRWRRTEAQLVLSQRENKEITGRINALKREILLVETDPRVLEEVARRNLGLVYRDELIFVFPGHRTAVQVSVDKAAVMTEDDHVGVGGR